MNKREFNQLDKRVKAGIKWLDEVVGREQWLKKIDLLTLRLAGRETCICGQVFKDFWNVVVDTSGDRGGALPRGVSEKMSKQVSYDRGFANKGERYDSLHNVWIINIMQLKGCQI